MPHNFIHFLDTIGAGLASAAGVVGVAGVAAGQIPIPPDTPSWVMALLMGVGPSVTWLFLRLLAAGSSYYGAIKKSARKRVESLQALPPAERPAGFLMLVASFSDRADVAEAREAALKAFRHERTGTGG